MTHDELALKLAATAGKTERAFLLRQSGALADVRLAYLLKNICLDSWASNPTRAVRAAESLAALAEIDADTEIAALAAWTDGLAQMINGRMRDAVDCFDRARSRFQSLGKHHAAASTQVGKLYPLAMLGLYDEAIDCGLAARAVFLEFSDFAAAGRIEHNLGNIFQRSDRYEEAESFLREARARFISLDDPKQLAQITNSLAFVLSNRCEFREAEAFYEEALRSAELSGLTVTKAEIESNLGYFSLFQGRYDRALVFLERARVDYAALGMPHQSAIAELEMADAYLELNLYREAAAVYARVIPLFAEIGMPLEHARALMNVARVEFIMGNAAKSHVLLDSARQIFASCRSEIGEANALLSRAQFLFAERKFEEAVRILGQAEIPLARAGIKGGLLTANFLRAESRRALGDSDEAKKLLEATLRETEANEIPPLAARCLTALGLLENSAENALQAENYFRRAISIIENMRAPLPSEDFRTAFFGDKLAPYTELVKICLTDSARHIEALEMLEKSRSRSLLELMRRSAPDNFPAAFPSNTTGELAAAGEQGETNELDRQIGGLREELNWLYNRINQPVEKAARNADENLKLHEAARERENRISELTRKKNLRRPADRESAVDSFDLAALCDTLGSDTVLVEFAEIDGAFAAFVIGGAGVHFFPDLLKTDEAARLLRRFHFQLDALRRNPQLVQAHLYELTLRTRAVLAEFYDALLRPLESFTGSRRLVVAPHGALHYVPFHALYDGFKYAVEIREIVYAPSAGVLRKCLEKPRRKLENFLFVGVSDERIPLVDEEIAKLAELFPGAPTLSNEAAAFDSLAQAAAGANVLHLACHGQFRPENPLFSSLKLADRWLTVGDIGQLSLDAELIVLSACETGVSRIAPGDELLGLMRGFFSAGASSLVMSLWNVHDAATLDLMKVFYRSIRAGAAPAAALRAAQCAMLEKRPHPFFWSPFIIAGRW